MFLGCKGIRHVPYSVSQEIGNKYCWSGVCRGKGELIAKIDREFYADKLSYIKERPGHEIHEIL